MKFIHKISKGSRYNQIYIPKEKEADFEVGSLVEIRLLKKSSRLYYSKNLPKLSPFKEKLIKDIFNFLSNHKQVKQAFIFGSFLTKSFDYNDIDILLLTGGEDEKFEKLISRRLLEQFNLKLHILAIPENKLDPLLSICPLTRSMLYYYVSNKEFKLPQETKIDEKHIKFLLMMAEDLLNVDLEEGTEYYHVLRRLVTIERFLRNKEIAPDKIDLELERIMGREKLALLKENTFMEKFLLEELKKIIKKQLQAIYKHLEEKNGEN